MVLTVIIVVCLIHLWRWFRPRFGYKNFVQWRIRSIAYPAYSCLLCVGQEPWQGCYCSYYNAYSPDDPNGRWWQRAARWGYDRMFNV